MKKLISILCLVLTITFAKAQSNFGKQIDDKSAIAATALPAKMGDKNEMQAKVTGVVESVCQAKGCWMKVNLDNGETMRVVFKDYAFFVPKDITGKTVVFEGEAKKTTASAEHLRHYAQDAGQSKEEIAKITEPKDELTFVAEGVIVK
ncbi:hypothetical protein GCM10007423_43240 [Dyadobacter endophyticus]|uniref:DUF4920 domain-containing protein n=1 Tax=Dyadobacter endophyticus TaxID=1749036 RepID=A0ABQ1YZQ0_9BACT|nr:DUF4920 domain-containing protein [Dyadobacter endophyticus]GGH44802.1 hypothetical protein GCM10007423_43240 [Dyadobacter endophyticus]